MSLLRFPLPDDRKQYVVRKISTNEILFRNRHYPTSTDDSVIVGLDADIEYLAMDADAIPDYDSRIFTLVTSETKVGNLWKITHDPQKKETDQIKAAVVNAEAAQIQVQLVGENQTKLILLGLNVLFSSLDGLKLTDEQQSVKDRIAKASSALWQNDAKVAELNAAIDAGETPDLDTVWAVKS